MPAPAKDLPTMSAVNTAMDAFSHAVEGMLSRNATPMSDMLAKESLRILYPLLPGTKGETTDDERDALLYASMLAGMTIAQSGTTAVHGMGYCLTYFHNVDHGRANGLLLGETLRLCREKGVPALEEILSACGDTLEGVCDTLDALLGVREDLPAAELREYARRSAQNKNIKKSAYEPTEAELERIFMASCHTSRRQRVDISIRTEYNKGSCAVLYGIFVSNGRRDDTHLLLL